MIRSSWKHNYVYYGLIKRLFKNSKKNKHIGLRNRNSSIHLSFLSKLKNYTLYIYNGNSYSILYLDLNTISSKLGEFVFTKSRGRNIHAANSVDIVKGMKNKRNKNFNRYKKPRRFGFRTRYKRRYRY
jgi:ribosomal protein S19